MKLAEMTWPEVHDTSRDVVVLIPTGSLEQHGPHLPLFTDSILATAAAEAVEARLPEQVLLAPTLWLGASGHHLAFPGSLSNSMDGYGAALESVVRSLARHGFHRFYVLNGHGGNTSLNDVAVRRLKEADPSLTIGHTGYFQFIPDSLLAATLDGPIKGIRHACEAEASLMMHVRPDLVRADKLRDDGLNPEPPVRGVVGLFDEVTEEGSFGYATLASAAKGRVLFEAAVDGAVAEVSAIAAGLTYVGPA